MEKNNINTVEFWDDKYTTEGFYQDKCQFQFKDFWKPFLQEIFKGYKYANIKVLEVACGLAQCSNYLSENMPNSLFIATDISEVAIEESKKRYSRDNLIFSLANIKTATLSNEMYDAVMAFEILEHFHEPVVPLRQMYECLNKGGKLIFSTPMKNGLSDDMDFHYTHWDYNQCTHDLLTAGFSKIIFYKNDSNHNQITGVAIK